MLVSSGLEVGFQAYGKLILLTATRLFKVPPGSTLEHLLGASTMDANNLAGALVGRSNAPRIV